MQSYFDYLTREIIVRGNPEEFYRNAHTREFLPQAIRAELDERRRLSEMNPTQRAEAMREKRSFLTPEERSALDR